jgi:EmrB/QacA subfamily drug resistance transporter
MPKDEVPAMQDPYTNPHHERRWPILFVIAIAQLMVVLDATVVNIALPSAQEALAFSDDQRQWVITAYALAFGSLLLLGGRIGDLFGRKRAFVIGLGGFAGASALGGFAQSFEVLVAARALQGVFGALLAPAALSILTTVFTDPEERGKAFGVFGAVAVGGAAIGLILGGVLTQYLNWRWCLYVNLAFAVPAMLAAIPLLHNEIAQLRSKIDIPGTLTATGGLFAIVYGLANSETNGWADATTIAMLAASVALLTAFVVIQTRSANPLLPLRVVLDRDRGGSFLAMALAGAGMFGVFLFLTYYLQQNLGFSPIECGFAFLPMTVSIVIAATSASTKLLPKVGARPLISGGMLLAAAGLVSLTGIGVDTAYVSHVLPGILVIGAGMGMVFASAMATATFGVQAGDAGVASAMVNTMQQIGGSIGTALLSTLAASAVADRLAEAAVRPDAALAAQAAVHGYTTAFWWAAGIYAVGGVICAALLTRRSVEVAHQVPAGEPAFAHG